MAGNKYYFHRNVQTKLGSNNRLEVSFWNQYSRLYSSLLINGPANVLYQSTNEHLRAINSIYDTFVGAKYTHYVMKL